MIAIFYPIILDASEVKVVMSPLIDNIQVNFIIVTSSKNKAVISLGKRFIESGLTFCGEDKEYCRYPVEVHTNENVQPAWFIDNCFLRSNFSRERAVLEGDQIRVR